MQKIISWVKKHKIWSVLIVMAIGGFTLMGTASPSTPSTDTTQKSASQQSTTQPAQEPKLTYTVNEDKNTYVSVLIPASYDNAETMKQLGSTLKQAYDTSDRSHVFVYVFDDKTAADLLETVLSGKDTTAQDATYDPHLVAEYQKNAPTNFNQFTIQIHGGVNDNNPTTIKY